MFSLFQLPNVREQEENNHARICDVISCIGYMGTQQCVNVPAGHEQRLGVGH